MTSNKMAEETVRPWGNYTVVGKTKIIEINPKQKLSYQSHNLRDEFWLILNGDGNIIIDGLEKKAYMGDDFYIAKGKKHRAIAGNNGLTFLEISTGIVDEDDIIRYEDDYGRIK